MAKAKSVPFSPVDAAWLHMETPTSSAVITSVMMFDELVEWRRFREMVECRMLKFERFKMRVKEPRLGLGRPRWEYDPHFCLDSHIHRIALPNPGGPEELHALVGDIMSTWLDFSKPLWQIYLVENFGKGCAVVTRLHHCVADGMALMQVLLSMTDCERDGPAPVQESAPQQEPERGLGGAIKPAVERVSKTLDSAENLLYEGAETVADPGRLIDLAATGVAAGQALGKLVLSWPDRKTFLRGEPGVPKRAAWTEPLSLQDVKAVGKTFDGTINDVLISCLSGAIGRYMEGRGEATEGLNIRAMVPVNLRKEDELDEMGNRFGLVLLSLPVGVKDPAKRLRILKKRMDDIKNSPEAAVALGILGGMGLTPIQVEKLILWFFAMKASTVMTNVPGPRQRLYYAGQPIRNMAFWVPTPGDLTLGTSIFSYNGTVTVGVQTDAGIVPDPDAVIAAFNSEFQTMLGCVKPTRRAQKEETAPEKAEPRRKNGHSRANGHEQALCQATTKSGLPCRNHALPGQTTCARHIPVREKVQA